MKKEQSKGACDGTPKREVDIYLINMRKAIKTIPMKSSTGSVCL